MGECSSKSCDCSMYWCVERKKKRKWLRWLSQFHTQNAIHIHERETSEGNAWHIECSKVWWKIHASLFISFAPHERRLRSSFVFIIIRFDDRINRIFVIDCMNTHDLHIVQWCEHKHNSVLLNRIKRNTQIHWKSKTQLFQNHRAIFIKWKFIKANRWKCPNRAHFWTQKNGNLAIKFSECTRVLSVSENKIKGTYISAYINIRILTGRRPKVSTKKTSIYEKRNQNI